MQYRLEACFDEAEVFLVDAILEGGARMNMNLSSIACTVEGLDVSVKSLTSLNKGNDIDNVLMEAIVRLHTRRDEMVLEAYLVNEKKAGYTPRRACSYVSPDVTRIMFSTEYDDSVALQNPAVILIVASGKLLASHRTVLPYYWAEKKEWMLMIVDSTVATIHIIYARYLPNDDPSVYAADKEQHNRTIISR